MKQLVDLSNNQIELKENGEIIGLYVLDGKEEISSNIKFVHNLKRLKTRITIKFVLLDQSRLDLEATVKINKGAENTDTYLKIDVLLLSEEANAHVVPSMEIQEDDVRGGHGATIGMLDEKQVWYLMSRGMSKLNAEKLLVKGFIDSLLVEINDENIKNNIMKKVAKLI